jgi:cysteine synthase
MRSGALDGIGRTPLIRLSSLPAPDDAEVWVKLEAANPTGSYAALRLARELGHGHRVATIQPDSGLKYLAVDLFAKLG